MLRIIIYAILFVLGYRVLKRFFSPNFGEVESGPKQHERRDNFQSFPEGKSDEIEDVDYEEID